MKEVKPLDIVETPKGDLALVTETHRIQPNMPVECSIKYLNKLYHKDSKNAWWLESELKVVNTLPLLLAEGLCHPFGDGLKNAIKHFGI